MENGFRCSRCGFEYPQSLKFGGECRWCFDERECCSAGGVLV